MARPIRSKAAHKFHAVPTVFDGIRFASKKEAKRYQELLLMKAQGIVKEIEVQPSYLLQPGFERNGRKFRPINYRADFRVTYFDGTVEVEDVKGFRTREFERTEKLLLYRYPDLRFKVGGELV